jgi:iron-sulfur cluster repair protein YtfE (RIC family)
MGALRDYLARDHAHCDALMRRTATCVGRRDWDPAKQAILAFQGAMEGHLLVEESVLFPAFEAAFGQPDSPTRTMRAEHLRIRAVAGRLADSVSECDADAFATHAEVLLLLLHQHAEKEEGVLYPIIERVLARRCETVLAAMQAFGSMRRDAAPNMQGSLAPRRDFKGMLPAHLHPDQGVRAT